MATQSTVTGPIQAPTATTPTRGFIRFQLTDWDAEGGTIITTTKVEAPISDQDFSISLWASSEGDRGTNYKVTAFWYNATEDKWVQDEMGYCSVGDAGPYSLGDILVDDPIYPADIDYATAAALSAAEASGYADAAAASAAAVEYTYQDLDDLQANAISGGDGTIHTTRKEGFSYVEDSADPDVTENGVPLAATKVAGSYVALTQLGISSGSEASTAIAAALTKHKSVMVDVDCVVSSDIYVEADDCRLFGDGVVTLSSGAGITIEGDRTEVDCRLIGNSVPTFEITDVTGSTITSNTSLDWSDGMQLVVKRDDAFERCLWVGYVDSFSGDALTVADNAIMTSLLGASYSNVMAGKTVHVIGGSSYNHEVRLTGDNVRLGPRVSGSEVDFTFYNCNYPVHGDLFLAKGNLFYQYCFMAQTGHVVHKTPRFYGRLIEGCFGGKFGGLICDHPGFSGDVIKGLHEATVGDSRVSYAPVMSFQATNAPSGTVATPSVVNPNCQSDTRNQNVTWGDLYTEYGGAAAAIKSITGYIRFGDVTNISPWSAFDGDNGLFDRIEVNSFASTDAHDGGSYETSLSCAINMTGSGGTLGEFICHGPMSITGCDGSTSASSGAAAYFAGLKSMHLNGKTYFGGNRRGIYVGSVGEAVISDLELGPSQDEAFTIVEISSVERGNLSLSSAYEDTNTIMDRLILLSNGTSNFSLELGDIEFDGASVTPTQAVRLNTAGKNLTVTGGRVTLSNGATCGHVVRNDGACSELLIEKVKAGDAAEAVEVNNVTDYLQVINCQGTVDDNTTAPNKDTTTGNL